MAKKNRRFLALVLTLIMVFSLLPISGLAEGGENDADSGKVEQQGAERTAEGGKVKIQKTAAKTGKNTFDITLSTTTADDIKTTTTSNAAHVVLVIDRSGSMDDNNKLKKTIKAAQDFVNAFFGKDAAADNKLAVVSFADDASMDFALSDSGSKDTINAKIGKFSADGGTNTQGALNMARGILSAGRKADVKDIIVILSDGEPTYSYMLTGTAKWTDCSDRWGNCWLDWDKGHIDSSTIAVTGCDYDTCIGNGSSYSLGYGNLSVTSTCEHGNSRTDPVKYGDTKHGSGIVKVANNGYATIWEANQAKADGDEIYSILLSDRGSGKHAAHVMSGIATDSSHYKTTSDAASLGGIFNTISSTITTATDAGLVTDPMAKYIAYVGLKNPDADAAAATFDNATNTLTWDSSKTTATTNGDGSKTRTLTYTVTLDTLGDKFAEKTPYPTNGKTTFNYDIGGVSKALDFNVPTVSGIIPLRGYTVEYYMWDKTTKGYPGTPTKIVSESPVAVGTKVTPPTGYENEYTSYNYAFASGGTSFTIGENAESNVIKLYYIPVSASVTVNYYYKTTTTNVNGQTSVTEDYSNSTTQNTITDGTYVGDSYTLTPNPKAGGYTLDTAQSNSNLTISSLSATAADNVINLYYARAVDYRHPASVTVKRVYTYTQWDGTNFCYKTPVSVTVDEAPVTNLRQYDPYTVSTAPSASYSGYTFTGTTGSTGNVTVAKDDATMYMEAGNNVIQLNYSLKDPEPAKITVTVNHYYTKTTTTIDKDGNKTPTVDNGTGPVETIQVYPGQLCTAYSAGYTVYNGETYAPDATSKTINQVSDSENTIDFHYSLTDDSRLTPATLTVHYEYYLKEMAIDGSGNHYYKDDVQEEPKGTYKTYPENGGELYVGQYVDVDPGTDAKYPNAYDGTNPGTRVLVDTAAKEVTFKYYRTADLALAPVTVNYHYTLTTYTVDNGVLTPHVTDYPVISVTTNKYVGETYNAVGAPTHEGETYTLSSNPTPITVAALEGDTNPNVIDLNYTLSKYPPEAATVNVTYEYYTVDYKGDETEVTGLGKTIPASSYAGMDYTAPDGTTDGYTLSSKTATPNGFKDGTERTIVLAAGENAIKLTYEKEIKTPTSVTVNHIYRLGTPSSYTEEASYTENIVENVFAGYNFSAAERPTSTAGGSTYTYTFSSATPDKTIKLKDSGNVINMYYYRTNTPAPVDPTPTPTTPTTPTTNIPEPTTPTTDIPEPTTPTTDAPEPTTPTTDISDPDTPKADASEQTTGDELYLWIALAGASGLSLAWLVISDLKRRKGTSDK